MILFTFTIDWAHSISRDEERVIILLSAFPMVVVYTPQIYICTLKSIMSQPNLFLAIRLLSKARPRNRNIKKCVIPCR